MNRLHTGQRLVVASHNKGKVWEINQLIAPYGLDAVSAGELGLAEPEETEPTFAGNARLKALAAATASGMPALADDSGLEVDCLDGAPGIYSARWAGPGKDFGIAMQKLGSEISARGGWVAPGPRANFISLLCLAWPDGETALFEGKVYGHLVWPPRGGNGFGYDPMFVHDGDTRTFGEMAPDEKYAISHRTRAFAAFKAECLDHIEKVSAAPRADTAASRDLAAMTAAAASLSTREELVQFIVRLRADLDRHGTAWAGGDVATFLDRLRSALEAAQKPDAPPWRTMAETLLAAGRR